LMPAAAAGAAGLRAAGYALVCVTNQPAAAKGTVSVQRLLEVHRRVLELLAEEGVELDAWRMCLHHPEGVVPGLAAQCDCRKPAPGMLLDAGGELDVEMSRSWMVGDTDADVYAGRAAGCRTLLIASAHSAHKRSRAVSPDLLAADFQEAVRLVVDDPGR
jgi:D-glycero-D-manno-heptose 1,7-bisphosphate phosphatase